MKYVLLFFLVFFVLIFSSYGQMQLQLDNPIPSDNLTYMEKNIPKGMELDINNSLLIPSSDRLRQIKMLLILNFVAALTLGDFGEQWSTAFGGNLTFAYVLMPALMLTASVAYLSWVYKDDLPDGYDYSFNSIPIMIGLRYLFLRNMAAFMPFLLVKAGIHLLRDRFEVNIGNFQQENTSSDSKFGINFGAGFMYLLSAVMLIDFSIEYMAIFHDPDSINNLAFFIGLAYGIGAR